MNIVITPLAEQFCTLLEAIQTNQNAIANLTPANAVLVDTNSEL